MVKVMNARMVKRRRATPNAFSTVVRKRPSSRSSWPNAWTTFIAAQSLGDGRADVRDTVLRRAAEVADPAAEEDHRPEDDRDADDQHSGKLGRQREQIDDAADAGSEVAQGDRHARADDLLEDSGVGSQPRGDFRRPVLLEEARRQRQQVLLNRDAQVGDGPLANPRNEVEAKRRCRGEHDDDHQQIVERGADGLRPCTSGSEALIDHPLETVGDRQHARLRTGRGRTAPRRSAWDNARPGARPTTNYRFWLAMFRLRGRFLWPSDGD